MPSSRAVAVAVAAALTALGVAVVGTFVARDDGSASGASSGVRPRPSAVRDGSTAIEDRSPLVILDETGSYRIRYRVDTWSAGTRTTTEDTVSVRRPFTGHTMKPQSEQWGTLGKLLVPRSSSSDAALVATGPSLAPSDLRIAPVLDDLVAAGRVQVREWRRIDALGEGEGVCQVLRFGGPVSSGTVAAVLLPAFEYADVCVSGRGFVLEELWVKDGRVQRRRLATKLDEDVSPSFAFPTRGVPATPVPVKEGGGSFRPVDASSAYAAPFWVLDSPPLSPAAQHVGRWAVVAPAANDPKDDETRQRRLGYVADVWVDGIDVVVVEQGSTAGGVKPFVLGDGARVSSPDNGLGEGEVVLDLRTSEVRFLRSGGYFVKVRGTLSVARLTEIARSLRQTPGGTGLAYLD